jgi:O-antigen/teichoic acid export membrane protein
MGANLVLQVGANLLLEAFGHTYAGQAAWCLRILSLAVFPIIVKSHYLAVCRVYDRTKYIILPVAIGSSMELGAAALGAHMIGLMGLSLGWLGALVIEALYMSRTVYKAAFPVNVNTMVGKKPAKA